MQEGIKGNPESEEQWGVSKFTGKKRNHVSLSKMGRLVELKVLATSEKKAEEIFNFIFSFLYQIPESSEEDGE